MHCSTKRHILIAGGTGLVGRALLRALSADGNCAPIVLTRNPARAQRHLGGMAHCIDNLTQIAHPLDAIINLAGENLGSARIETPHASLPDGFGYRTGPTTKLLGKKHVLRPTSAVCRHGGQRVRYMT